ncbi:uncharacterized protein LOC108665688 [Hyalella azteca]|uniref:Uncharacterized protein LOC108665688 n=1 Tax=Hyalella azteca TaxID=294128 RepID=A0A8B7N3H8_HYAAZ|nr:uncharacterized protein LOC108665688 [Hyalella azteca]
MGSQLQESHVKDTIPSIENEATDVGQRDFVARGVYNFLSQLDIPENPLWRGDSNAPSISDMLQEIVLLRTTMRPSDSLEYHEKLYYLKLKFILTANLGEDEGTLDMASTKNAINKTCSNFTREEQVTRNLLDAINHLEAINQDGESKGLLDVEECIQDTHEILMNKLLSSNKLGEFSTEDRFAHYNGKIHYYPRFYSTDDAYKHILQMVDTYNSTVEYIKKSSLEPKLEISLYFRCAAWLLYNFVALHPFSDGNGRMCRLLASHCLYLVCPFPCPIYNVFAPTTRNDYLESVIKAQESGGRNLGPIVALLVESGWYTYRELLGVNACN